jgi:hypothetical protein
MRKEDHGYAEAEAFVAIAGVGEKEKDVFWKLKRFTT